MAEPAPKKAEKAPAPKKAKKSEKVDLSGRISEDVEGTKVISARVVEEAPATEAAVETAPVLETKPVAEAPAKKKVEKSTKEVLASRIHEDAEGARVISARIVEEAPAIESVDTNTTEAPVAPQVEEPVAPAVETPVAETAETHEEISEPTEEAAPVAETAPAKEESAIEIMTVNADPVAETTPVKEESKAEGHTTIIGPVFVFMGNTDGQSGNVESKVTKAVEKITYSSDAGIVYVEDEDTITDSPMFDSAEAVVAPLYKEERAEEEKKDVAPVTDNNVETVVEGVESKGDFYSYMPRIIEDHDLTPYVKAQLPEEGVEDVAPVEVELLDVELAHAEEVTVESVKPVEGHIAKAKVARANEVEIGDVDEVEGKLNKTTIARAESKVLDTTDIKGRIIETTIVRADAKDRVDVEAIDAKLATTNIARAEKLPLVDVSDIDAKLESAEIARAESKVLDTTAIKGRIIETTIARADAIKISDVPVVDGKLDNAEIARAESKVLDTTSIKGRIIETTIARAEVKEIADVDAVASKLATTEIARADVVDLGDDTAIKGRIADAEISHADAVDLGDINTVVGKLASVEIARAEELADSDKEIALPKLAKIDLATAEEKEISDAGVIDGKIATTTIAHADEVKLDEVAAIEGKLAATEIARAESKVLDTTAIKGRIIETTIARADAKSFDITPVEGKVLEADIARADAKDLAGVDSIEGKIAETTIAHAESKVLDTNTSVKGRIIETTIVRADAKSFDTTPVEGKVLEADIARADEKKAIDVAVVEGRLAETAVAHADAIEVNETETALPKLAKFSLARAEEKQVSEIGTVEGIVAGASIAKADSKTYADDMSIEGRLADSTIAHASAKKLEDVADIEGRITESRLAHADAITSEDIDTALPKLAKFTLARAEEKKVIATEEAKPELAIDKNSRIIPITIRPDDENSISAYLVTDADLLKTKEAPKAVEEAVAEEAETRVIVENYEDIKVVKAILPPSEEASDALASGDTDAVIEDVAPVEGKLEVAKIARADAKDVQDVESVDGKLESADITRADAKDVQDVESVDGKLESGEIARAESKVLDTKASVKGRIIETTIARAEVKDVHDVDSVEGKINEATIARADAKDIAEIDSVDSKLTEATIARAESKVLDTNASIKGRIIETTIARAEEIELDEVKLDEVKVDEFKPSEPKPADPSVIFVEAILEEETDGITEPAKIDENIVVDLVLDNNVPDEYVVKGVVAPIATATPIEKAPVTLTPAEAQADEAPAYRIDETEATPKARPVKETAKEEKLTYILKQYDPIHPEKQPEIINAPEHKEEKLNYILKQYDPAHPEIEPEIIKGIESLEESNGYIINQSDLSKFEEKPETVEKTAPVENAKRVIVEHFPEAPEAEEVAVETVVAPYIPTIYENADATEVLPESAREENVSKVMSIDDDINRTYEAMLESSLSGAKSNKIPVRIVNGKKEGYKSNFINQDLGFYVEADVKDDTAFIKDFATSYNNVEGIHEINAVQKASKERPVAIVDLTRYKKINNIIVPKGELKDIDNLPGLTDLGFAMKTGCLTFDDESIKSIIYNSTENDIKISFNDNEDLEAFGKSVKKTLKSDKLVPLRAFSCDINESARDFARGNVTVTIPIEGVKAGDKLVVKYCKDKDTISSEQFETPVIGRLVYGNRDVPAVSCKLGHFSYFIIAKDVSVAGKVVESEEIKVVESRVLETKKAKGAYTITEEVREIAPVAEPVVEAIAPVAEAVAEPTTEAKAAHIISEPGEVNVSESNLKEGREDVTVEAPESDIKATDEAATEETTPAVEEAPAPETVKETTPEFAILTSDYVGDEKTEQAEYGDTIVITESADESAPAPEAVAEESATETEVSEETPVKETVEEHAEPVEIITKDYISTEITEETKKIEEKSEGKYVVVEHAGSALKIAAKVEEAAPVAPLAEPVAEAAPVVETADVELMPVELDENAPEIIDRTEASETAPVEEVAEAAPAPEAKAEVVIDTASTKVIEPKKLEAPKAKGSYAIIEEAGASIPAAKAAEEIATVEETIASAPVVEKEDEILHTGEEIVTVFEEPTAPKKTGVYTITEEPDSAKRFEAKPTEEINKGSYTISVDSHQAKKIEGRPELQYTVTSDEKGRKVITAKPAEEAKSYQIDELSADTKIIAAEPTANGEIVVLDEYTKTIEAAPTEPTVAGEVVVDEASDNVIHVGEEIVTVLEEPIAPVVREVVVDTSATKVIEGKAPTTGYVITEEERVSASTATREVLTDADSAKVIDAKAEEPIVEREPVEDGSVAKVIASKVVAPARKVVEDAKSAKVIDGKVAPVESVEEPAYEPIVETVSESADKHELLLDTDSIKVLEAERTRLASQPAARDSVHSGEVRIDTAATKVIGAKADPVVGDVLVDTDSANVIDAKVEEPTVEREVVEDTSATKVLEARELPAPKAKGAYTITENAGASIPATTKADENRIVVEQDITPIPVEEKVDEVLHSGEEIVTVLEDKPEAPKAESGYTITEQPDSAKRFEAKPTEEIKKGSYTISVDSHQAKKIEGRPELQYTVTTDEKGKKVISAKPVEETKTYQIDELSADTKTIEAARAEAEVSRELLVDTDSTKVIDAKAEEPAVERELAVDDSATKVIDGVASEPAREVVVDNESRKVIKGVALETPKAKGAYTISEERRETQWKALKGEPQELLGEENGDVRVFDDVTVITPKSESTKAVAEEVIEEVAEEKESFAILTNDGEVAQTAKTASYDEMGTIVVYEPKLTVVESSDVKVIAAANASKTTEPAREVSALADSAKVIAGKTVEPTEASKADDEIIHVGEEIVTVLEDKPEPVDTKPESTETKPEGAYTIIEEVDSAKRFEAKPAEDIKKGGYTLTVDPAQAKKIEGRPELTFTVKSHDKSELVISASVAQPAVSEGYKIGELAEEAKVIAAEPTAPAIPEVEREVVELDSYVKTINGTEPAPEIERTLIVDSTSTKVIEARKLETPKAKGAYTITEEARELPKAVAPKADDEIIHVGEEIVTVLPDDFDAFGEKAPARRELLVLPDSAKVIGAKVEEPVRKVVVDEESGKVIAGKIVEEPTEAALMNVALDENAPEIIDRTEDAETAPVAEPEAPKARRVTIDDSAAKVISAKAAKDGGIMVLDEYTKVIPAKAEKPEATIEISDAKATAAPVAEPAKIYTGYILTEDSNKTKVISAKAEREIVETAQADNREMKVVNVLVTEAPEHIGQEIVTVVGDESTIENVTDEKPAVYDSYAKLSAIYETGAVESKKTAPVSDTIVVNEVAKKPAITEDMSSMVVIAGKSSVVSESSEAKVVAAPVADEITVTPESEMPEIVETAKTVEELDGSARVVSANKAKKAAKSRDAYVISEDAGAVRVIGKKILDLEEGMEVAYESDEITILNAPMVEEPEKAETSDADITVEVFDAAPVEAAPTEETKATEKVINIDETSAKTIAGKDEEVESDYEIVETEEPKTIPAADKVIRSARGKSRYVLLESAEVKKISGTKDEEETTVKAYTFGTDESAVTYQLGTEEDNAKVDEAIETLKNAQYDVAEIEESRKRLPATKILNTRKSISSYVLTETRDPAKVINSLGADELVTDTIDTSLEKTVEENAPVVKVANASKSGDAYAILEESGKKLNTGDAEPVIEEDQVEAVEEVVEPIVEEKVLKTRRSAGYIITERYVDAKVINRQDEPSLDDDYAIEPEEEELTIPRGIKILNAHKSKEKYFLAESKTKLGQPKDEFVDPIDDANEAEAVTIFGKKKAGKYSLAERHDKTKKVQSVITNFEGDKAEKPLVYEENGSARTITADMYEEKNAPLVYEEIGSERIVTNDQFKLPEGPLVYEEIGTEKMILAESGVESKIIDSIVEYHGTEEIIRGDIPVVDVLINPYNNQNMGVLTGRSMKRYLSATEKEINRFKYDLRYAKKKRDSYTKAAEKVVAHIAMINNQCLVCETYVDRVSVCTYSKATELAKENANRLAIEIKRYNELITEYNQMTNSNIPLADKSISKRVLAGQAYEHLTRISYTLLENKAPINKGKKTKGKIYQENRYMADIKLLNRRDDETLNDLSLIENRYKFETALLEGEKEIMAYKFAKNSIADDKRKAYIKKKLKSLNKEKAKALKYETMDNERYYRVLSTDTNLASYSDNLAKKKKVNSIIYEVSDLLKKRDELNSKLNAIYSGPLGDIAGVGESDKWREVKVSAAKRHARKLKGKANALKNSVPGFGEQKVKQVFIFNSLLDAKVEALATIDLCKYRLKSEKNNLIDKAQIKKDMREARKNIKLIDREIKDRRAMILGDHYGTDGSTDFTAIIALAIIACVGGLGFLYYFTDVDVLGLIESAKGILGPIVGRLIEVIKSYLM